MFVRVSTLSNMNISETSWSIAIKFYLKHHWVGGGGGEAAPDRIRCLVSLTTGDNEKNLVTTLAPSFLFGSSPFLPVTRTTKESRMSSKCDHIGPWTPKLAALEKKSPYTYNGKIVVTTLAPSF